MSHSKHPDPPKPRLRQPEEPKPAPKVEPPKPPTPPFTSPETPKPPVEGTPVTVVPPLPEKAPQPPLEPVVRAPEPAKASKPLGHGLSPLEEIAELRKRIASDEARVWELEHPIIEFPKMVKGRTFKDRAEQDAAGPEFADE